MEKSLLNVYNRFPLTLVKGSGCYVWDNQGKRYLDFVSGIAVNCLGHGHPAIAKTLAEQGQKLLHISNLYHSEPQLLLARKLTELTAMEKVFFTNSGTEAIELALKIARKFGNNLRYGKHNIVYMSNSFHGRSTGAIAVTGQPQYQTPFAPLMPATQQCQFNDCADLASKIDDNTCAVILEIIQGESGLEITSPEFIQVLQDKCRQHNALIIVDEIQSGMGRTGRLFAYEQFKLEPDIVTVAKALGGGFPIGACLTQRRATDVLTPGDHGSTYGGNPLGCAVALTVLEQLADKGLFAQVAVSGQYAKQQLLQLQQKQRLIKQIRGQGLLLGLRLQPQITARDFVSQAIEQGLLLVHAGNNVVRYLPPLNVNNAEIDESIQLLSNTLNHFA